MIAGVSGVMADPKKELTTPCRRPRHPADGHQDDGRRRRPARRRRRCGDGKAEGVPLGVCIWADRGSLGMVVLYFKSAADRRPSSSRCAARSRSRADLTGRPDALSTLGWTGPRPVLTPPTGSVGTVAKHRRRLCPCAKCCRWQYLASWHSIRLSSTACSSRSPTRPGAP